MGRLNNFDGLRLIAAFMVLWSHMFALSGRVEPQPVWGHSVGNIGVLMFFSISGYLVTASWRSDPNLVRFLIRRSLRIIPGLAVAGLAAFAVVGKLGLLGFPDNKHSLLNGSLWTIPFEVYCYLILAGVALVLPRRGIPLLLIMLAGFLFNQDSPRSTLWHFGLFFAMGAILQEHRAARSHGSTIAMITLGAILVVLGNVYLALAFIVPPLTILAGERTSPWISRAGRFGDLSYGVYLYAWPVQQLVVVWLGEQAHFMSLLTVSSLITLTCAMASWRYVEKPAIGLKPKHPRVHGGRSHQPQSVAELSARND